MGKVKATIVTKENGVVTKQEDYEKLPVEGCAKLHLCNKNCANLSPLKCVKVRDIHKKPLTAYAFITDGKQLIDHKNRVLEFWVMGCNNYQVETNRKYTPSTQQYVKSNKKK